MSNEVHRKTDTLFTEPLTIQSGGSSSNHYSVTPINKSQFDGHSFFKEAV